MNSTKLLFITSEFPPQPGGIGNHAVHLASSLTKQGYEVSVLTNDRSSDGIEEKEFDAVQSFKVHRVPRYHRTFKTYLQRLKEAQIFIKSHEVIIASGKFSLWMIGVWSLFYKRKYIAVLHGSELKLSKYVLRLFTRYCLKRFDELIAVSNFTKNLLPSKKFSSVTVIPNGFVMEADEKRPILTSSPQLITVGNVTRRKGQHHVVNALPIALEKYPDLQYTMVGIPTEQQKIIDLASVLGVEDAIRCTGKISEEEKIKHLRQATIFVMLSETTHTGDVEGFGIAILEANALGIPAIGAKGCGIEDAIDHDVSGLLINGSDAHALVEAIEKITNHYTEFSKNARQWSTQFSWDLIVKRYIEIIERE